MVRRSHLRCMSNHTIAAPITTWAEARTTDREVLNRAEVPTLLPVDAGTLDHAIDDGTIPATRLRRRGLSRDAPSSQPSVSRRGSRGDWPRRHVRQPAGAKGEGQRLDLGVLGQFRQTMALRNRGPARSALPR